MQSLKGFLCVSFALAGFAFALPAFYNPSQHFGTALNWSYLASGIWMLLVLYGLLRIGRRGLWLLAGAPLSLLWPVVMLWLYLACAVVKDCI
jgi:hypothetical protein